MIPGRSFSDLSSNYIKETKLYINLCSVQNSTLIHRDKTYSLFGNAAAVLFLKNLNFIFFC